MANQIVASSSSSSLSTLSWSYDVFLSFRGEDTRTNFTDHLYKALVNNGIHTFIDRQLPRGEEISPALAKAIEESRISLVIFSKNYASSRWCLDELVRILQCRESKQQIVLPIFYKVDPSHVRNQTSNFGDSFTELERKFDDKEKVLMWRRALREVANLSGHPFRKGDSEATFISNIVEEILVKVLEGTDLNVAKYPVGIESCVKEVEELLGVGGNDRRVVGIWGTSGIGKTTIAKAVYTAIAHKFEGSCFLADVRDTSMQHRGLLQLQKTILSKILCGTKLPIDDAHHGISLIKKLLRLKKILLILDDVDELAQLNNLVEINWFGEGSRVIITTKDKGLLKSYGVELIYEVQKLEDGKALELFSWNAFETKEPSDDYLGLARRAIAYAQGHPLALNLIGSYLRNKSIDRWQAVLDSYNSYDGEPYRGIQKILRKSYDAWDEIVQQVFLDIACFFKGEDKDYVLQILRSSKLNVPEDCIEVLIENAIITIEGKRILMHDLLEKMGKRIVREESLTEPGERSRLWHHEDVYHVLTQNRGTKKIKGIVVKFPIPDVIPLNANSFLGMVNLEFFLNRNACFSGCVDYLSNDLRWIELSARDFEDLGSNIHQKHLVTFTLQSNFRPKNLVMFDMSYSGIRELKGFKDLAKLTSINLNGCEFLEKIPDLCGSPNIKHLYLSECKSLVEVDDSVGFLDKLVDLNLSGCSKLTRFATRLKLRSLEWLYLSGCTGLETFPEIDDKMESLWYLDIQESGIRELPSSFAYLNRLAYLRAHGCENLTCTSLHNISGLQHLIEVDFSECSKLVTFGNKVKFDEVSSCSTECQLFSTDLDTSHDNCITFSPSNFDNREWNLSERFMPQSTLGCLDLSKNNFVSLPDCISKLVNLWELRLRGCKRLREIPQVLPPKLVFLYLNYCTALEKIPKLPGGLKRLELTNCFGLSGDEVEVFENKLMKKEFSMRYGLEIIYPRNEVPKWFNYTSNHPTTIEFFFEIPPGKKLSGLALSIVFVPMTFQADDFYFLINGRQQSVPCLWGNSTEATHMCLKLVNLDEGMMNLDEDRGDMVNLDEDRGDICQVIFQFPKSADVKSCGVHLLSRKCNPNKRLHLSLGPTTSLGKRPRTSGSSDIVDDEYDHLLWNWCSLGKWPCTSGSSDIVDDEYDQQQQWLSFSLEPVDDHPKRRHIDPNVPITINEEQEQTST